MNQSETWADCDGADESDESGASNYDDHLFWRLASTTDEQMHVYLGLKKFLCFLLQAGKK